MHSAPISPISIPISLFFSIGSFMKNGEKSATVIGIAVPKMLPVFAVVRERPV